MTGLAWSLCLFAHLGFAAETGTIRGRVEDVTGSPVGSARVIVTGEHIQVELSTLTNDNGRFVLLGVPVGVHDVVIESDVAGMVARQVAVRLDEVSLVRTELRGAAEQDVGSDVDSALDVTRTAVSTNLETLSLRQLPISSESAVRSYNDALRVVPGVLGRINYEWGGPGDGNHSVRGEGAYGNNYLVNGMSTRNPKSKYFGMTVPYDSITAIQVYTDAAPAEFGQATGMIANLVTMDGTNEHRSEAAYFVARSLSGGAYPILDLQTAEEVDTSKRFFFDQALVGSASGPLVEDALWYAGAVEMDLGSVSGEGSPDDFASNTRAAREYGRLSYSPSRALMFRYTFIGNQDGETNVLDPALHAPEAQSDDRNLGVIQSLELEWRPSSEIRLDVKALGQFNRHVLDSVNPDATQPQVVERDSGFIRGNSLYEKSVFRYSRYGVTASAELAVRDWFGSHVFKSGVEAFRLGDSRLLDITGPEGGVSFVGSVDEGRPCVSDDFSDCYSRTEFDELDVFLGHSSTVLTAYVQDSWQLNDRLAANVGYRLDTETVFQNERQPVLTFVMPAPRLGVAWDPNGKAKSSVFVNYGRYYDLAGGQFAGWFDTRSDNTFRTYTWSPDAGTFTLTRDQDQSRQPALLCAQSSLEPLGPIQQQQLDTLCQGKLRNYHMDKVVLGARWEFQPQLVGGLRGIASVTRNFPESVTFDPDTNIFANVPIKRRDYQAVEATLERPYDGDYQIFASYTLSRSAGTNPGHFESPFGSRLGSYSNNGGAFLDDLSSLQSRAELYDSGLGSLADLLRGTGTTTDDAGYYGLLPYHSWHYLKFSGVMTLPTGTTLSGVYELDSGHAWEKRTLVTGYGGYYSFNQGRGSRLMKPVQYVDVMVRHDISVSEQRTVSLRLDVFNPLDLRSPITIYDHDNDAFGSVLYRQPPRSFRLSVRGHL